MTIKNPYLYVTGFTEALRLAREELGKPDLDKVKIGHLLDEMDSQYEDLGYQAMGEDL